MTKKKVCVVVGVGPGNGAALGRRFAKEGFAVALLARTTGTSEALAASLEDARAYACDVSDAVSVAAAFERSSVRWARSTRLSTTPARGRGGRSKRFEPSALEGAFRVNALGLLITAKKVIPQMKAAGGGNIVVIGATSSRRGIARTAAFAPAKAAQKSLAESMARHLWPQKIHVSLIIVNSVVDLPRSRAFMKDKPDDFFISPDAVAATAFHLTTQDPSAWSFEVEARPFKETW